MKFNTTRGLGHLALAASAALILAGCGQRRAYYAPAPVGYPPPVVVVHHYGGGYGYGGGPTVVHVHHYGGYGGGYGQRPIVVHHYHHY